MQHKCDSLITSNCKQLANANKFQHVHQVNTRLGLDIPTLLTLLNFWANLMSQNFSEPVIDEIRAIRERIWAKSEHDPAKLVAYY